METATKDKGTTESIANSEKIALITRLVSKDCAEEALASAKLLNLDPKEFCRRFPKQIQDFTPKLKTSKKGCRLPYLPLYPRASP